MPVANALNMSSAGIPTMSTAGIYTASTPTQYNVQVGGASNLLASVAPSATSGVPLISSGAAANPAFGTAVVAGGGTGLTTATAYAVLCGGTTATGALQSIASVGTAAQVLTSNGAGALPTFQAAAGGAAGWTLISTATASVSASLVFTSGIDSTYNMYALVFDQLLPSTDSTQARLRVSTDGGSTYKSTGYATAGFYSTASVVAISNATDQIPICRQGFWKTGGMGVCGIIYMANPSATQRIGFFGQTITNNSLLSFTPFGAWDTATAVNALQITSDSGNIQSGTVKLYGISKP